LAWGIGLLELVLFHHQAVKSSATDPQWVRIVVQADLLDWPGDWAELILERILL
jgi:hypothetical protein